MSLEKLEGAGRAGDFVHTSQQMSGEAGFKNVSSIWLKKCISYDEGLEKLSQARSESEDITASLSEMVPYVSLSKEGRAVCGFKHLASSRFFSPTPYCIEQIGSRVGTGSWFVKNLSEDVTDSKGKILYSRDVQDADTLRDVLYNAIRRLDQNKEYLWRVRKDGTLRAMLSDRYAIVDNEWFVQALAKLIPDGMLSHWRGDSDTLYGNILIPDTLRVEDDSDYGGMLSIGNSEIGERRISSIPSVFRAICMNGCIWDSKKGVAVFRVHRGKIDLEELYEAIKINLEEQIPLLPQCINQLLASKELTWNKTVSVKPIFAQLAKQFKLGKGQASAVFDAYGVEASLTPELASSLFCVTNAVTRAAQGQQRNEEWLRFDGIGGTLAAYNESDWQSLLVRATTLKTKEVEEAFLAV